MFTSSKKTLLNLFTTNCFYTLFYQRTTLFIQSIIYFEWMIGYDRFFLSRWVCMIFIYRRIKDIYTFIHLRFNWLSKYCFYKMYVYTFIVRDLSWKKCLTKTNKNTVNYFQMHEWYFECRTCTDIIWR